jgi:hypothetical protein
MSDNKTSQGRAEQRGEVARDFNKLTRDQTNARRPGRIEQAILAEIRAAGGASNSISDHGPGTGKTIDRMEEKGWLIAHPNQWSIGEQAP